MPHAPHDARDFAIGDEVIVAGGAYAGEKGKVVARDDDQITVSLTLFGKPTRMAFDRSALVVPSRDPRAQFRTELEAYFQRCAREDIIRWFAERDPADDLLETDEIACLYQLARPLRLEYLRIVDEFDVCFDDAASLQEGTARLTDRWEEKKAEWFARLTPPAIDASVRARGLALMDRVRAVAPGEDPSNEPS